MLSEIKASLKRKFGPLPAWAWVLIAGAGIYVWRMRGAATNQSGASLDATAPDVTDSTGNGQQDPTILQPGESAYNPNTGQLVSAAPEQQPPLDPQSPVVLDPGQIAYDPNTGETIDPGKGAAKAKPKTKRTPKAKPNHKATKKVKHPTPVKSKPRGKGRLLAIKGRGKGHVPGGYKARTRGAATARPSGASRVRASVAKMPAMRQRPAATHATAPHTQRVAPHPARSVETHHAPTVHPQTKRRTKRK